MPSEWKNERSFDQKTKRNGSKNAYINQNESKKRGRAKLMVCKVQERVYTKRNALKTPQISVQARIFETIRGALKAVLLSQERFLGCYKPILTAIRLF